jgi:serine/threonine-protein kinase
VRGGEAAPAAPPPPPPAPSPGVVEWSRRAANFLRATARAYPNGKAPDDIQRAADKMWDLAARAARLEGELSSHSRKLEAIEKRGRALRAEIGRKVEELAGEESRSLRDATAERDRANTVVTRRREASSRLGDVEKQADAAMRTSKNVTELRTIFEELGAARARIVALEEVERDYERRAMEREQYGAGLRKQIDELKGQLQRYSEALENDLQAGRERIATRVREALGYEKDFQEACGVLLTHLRGRPDVRELLEDLEKDLGTAPSNSASAGPDDATSAA